MLSYKKCLIQKDYIIEKKLKETKNNIVLHVLKKSKIGNNKEGINRVAKILNLSKTTDKLEILNMKTEIEALKYFTYELQIPFFVNYKEDYICKKNYVVIMDYIKGKLLIEYDNKKMNDKWWLSLLYQLILIIYILEDNRILHNDFWDANVIIQPIKKPIKIEYKNKVYDIPESNFMIKIIDFQYTNQYKTKTKIYSEYVMNNEKDSQEEKKRLGWSSKFHVGGDLNQILGLLSNYKYIPDKIRKNLNKIVIKKSDESDFPYAIQKTNNKTSGKYLLHNFHKLFVQQQ